MSHFKAPVCQEHSDNWEDMFFNQVQRDQEKTNLATPCELNENSNDDEVQEIQDQNSAMEDASKFFELIGS